MSDVVLARAAISALPAHGMSINALAGHMNLPWQQGSWLAWYLVNNGYAVQDQIGRLLPRDSNLFSGQLSLLLAKHGAG